MMAEDRLREEKEKSPLDHAASLGKAALTVGVGAALFYRGGGKRLLSRGAEISKRVLREAKDELGGKALKELGGSAERQRIIDSLFTSSDSAFKRAVKEVSESTVDLRTESPKSVGGMISDYLELKHNRNKILKRKFNVDRIIMPTKADFVPKMAGDDEVLGRQIERFIEGAIDRLNDPYQLMELAQNHKLTQKFDQDEILQIAKSMKERLESDNTFDEYAKAHARSLDKALQELIDPDNLSRVFGSAADGKTKIKDVALGDSAVTIGDILSNEEKFLNNPIFYKTDKGENKVIESVRALKEIREELAKVSEEKAQAFEQVLFDPGVLRKDSSGEIYSFKAATDLGKSFLDDAAKSLPGKIGKLRDILETRKAPGLVYSPMGEVDAIRAAKVGSEAGPYNQSHHLYILGRFYEFSTEELKHLPELDDTYLISGRYGVMNRLHRRMIGDDNYRRAGNAAARALDVGQEGQPTLWENVKSIFGKFEDPKWKGNIINDLLTQSSETAKFLSETKGLREDGIITTEMKQVAYQTVDKAKELNKFFSKNTYSLNLETINKLKEHVSGDAKEYLNLLSLDDSDLIKQILMRDSSSVRDISSHMNQDLITLLNTYIKDPKSAVNKISIKPDPANFFDGRKTSDFFDILRTEIGKEVFMRHAAQESASGRLNFDAVSDLIEKADLSGEARKQTRRLADWAAFQAQTNISSRPMRNANTEDLLDIAESITEMFISPKDKEAVNAKFFDEFRKNLVTMSADKIKYFESSYKHFVDNTDNLVQGNEYAPWITMGKAVTPLDLLKNINDSTKWKAFFKQFNAGRKDPENITTLTMIPYFTLMRLSDALTPIGLGFSIESTASTGDMIKNIMLKRVLPIAAGVTYLDYMNDLTGVVTGRKATEVMASGVANIDLGFRKVTDTLGLSQWLEDEKTVNPFLEYFTGDEYMTYDERKEWYESGYSPMRKSRWWSFGSISEFRGSSIAYWQPNYLRRISSNYKDVSLYDSHWEKWSRSWFPTPTNPLSPLFYLADPYWLERKHAEDRPYPMTGKMFEEHSPWGVVLNPTLGELIKPQRPMHRDRLDRNFVDVKALIEQHNREIHEKARMKESGNLIRLKDGIIEPVTFTPLSAPTMSERVLQLQINDGQVAIMEPAAYQQFSGVMSAQQFLDVAYGSPAGIRAGTGEGFGIVGDGGSGFGGGGMVNAPAPIEGLSFRDELKIRAQAGEFLPEVATQILNTVDPMYEIEKVNQSIFARSYAMQSRPREKGVVTPESIYRQEARYGSHVLENKEAMADLRGLSAGDDFIGELAYSARYIAGIYGYGAHMLFPGQPRYKLADASAIGSYSRMFEDMNLGGLGGGYAEIIRRFLPFENRLVNKVNPLLNTMPDWMPEKFRYGDPYTILPKGEARLPGKGYEALNELHPDQFGTYGAFDRFKILADIAPYSMEYKVWRDIASRTVQDPELREEMQDIRERVAEQSKSHDFHNYTFLGRGVDRQRAVVEEVLNNNYFTIVGDDRVYRMAGISVSPGQDGENVLEQYLVPGMDIVLVTDEDPYQGTNEDQYSSINAAVFIDGQNLNRQLLRQNMARKRDNDTSAAAGMAQYSDFQIARGKFFEALSHAPIPYFQQKFFKIRTPLESYKHEEVYGTSYASWTRPIDSFLKPAIERSLMSGTEVAIGAGALALNQFLNSKGIEGRAGFAANAALMLTNRGAFIGGFMGMMLNMTGGSYAKTGAIIGAYAQIAAFALTRSDDVVGGTTSFAAIGGAIGKYFGDNKGMLKGTGVGALVGLALSAAQSSVLNDEGLSSKWIPERTEEKWEMQEYFDRLRYLKYAGLYEKAARKALLFEGTDIKKLVHQYEQSQQERSAMREELEYYRDLVERIYPKGSQEAEGMLGEIDYKLKALEDSEMMLSVGKWGKTALIYKQAMDSTIYGLQENASWAQILRAIPRNDRDYFIEFAKEKNPEKREEILQYVSPYTRRALQIAWGEEPDEPESMTSFFSRHKLPSPFWSGWRPNVDLADIEVKTIHNEGMLLSDFGYYESQLRDPDVIHAPNLDPNEKQDAISMRANLISVLQGLGLTGVNVSVVPSSKPGIEVVANMTRMAQYNVQEKFKELISF